MRLSRLTFCGLLCVMLAVPAFAQEKCAPREKAPEHFKKMFEQLSLNDKQKEAMETNKAAHRGKMKQNFEKMKALKDEFNAELMKPKLNMSKINSLQKQFKAMQAQLADDRLSSILEVRKILTAEQFAKFISLANENEKRYHFKNGGKDGPQEPEPFDK